MGENYMDTSFYPHHGPSKYSYTSAFGAANNREKTAAQAKANTAYSGLATKAGNKFKILFNLKVLIDGARSAEMKFLADSGIDLTNGDNAQAIFKNFNLILNSKKLFERNLKILEQLSKKGEGKLIDPTKFFHTYLLKAIDEIAIGANFNIHKATDKQLQDMVNKIMDYAVEKTFTSFKEAIDKNGNIQTLEGNESFGDREQYQAMTEIIELIRQLKGTGLFGKFASAFQLEDILRDSTNRKTGKLKKPKISSQKYGQGGTPLELITTAIGAEFAKIHQSVHGGFVDLNIKGVMTGGSNFNEQKGDTIIAYAKGETDLSDMERIFEEHKKDGGSKRVQNVKAFAEYLNNVSESIEHLLVISDKNSFITAKYEGVHAQDSMRLDYARSMLTLFGVPGVDGLIDYLANAGSGMIQGEVNAQIRTALMSYIAYFLFDHVEITGTVRTGPNVVNIMNLSGTYIPLSVFLEGVYKSLDARLSSLSGGSGGDASSLVRVIISLKGEAPVGAKWTPGLWQGFRETRETSSTIEYKIMMDIADYITGLMG